MFAYLKGQLISASPSQAVLEVQGVGYFVFIPCSALGQLPHIGEPVKFYTSLVIREFSHALYGFLNSQERDLFEVLLNVTGIGPKLAISLIGHLPLDQLRTAVNNQDLPTLCRVPGVGKKTAERLVVELRDKLAQFLATDPSDYAVSNLDPRTQHANDAILALMNLGYNQNTAQKAVKQSLKDLSGEEEIDLASIITTALRNI